ncbi:MAG: hypothetical protein ACE5GG_00275 [Candidatus Omnitrophota bacterium]
MDKKELLKVVALGAFIVIVAAGEIRYLYLSTHLLTPESEQDVQQESYSDTADMLPADGNRYKDNGHRPVAVVKTIKADASDNGEQVLARFISPTQCVVSRKILKQRVKNINFALNEVRVLPIITQGKMRGFKIDGLKEKSVVRQLGLRPGDTIRAVNGQRLNNINIPFRIYSRLKNAPLIQVELERQGQRINMTYTIK